MEGVTRIMGDMKWVFIDLVRKLIEIESLDVSIALNEYKRWYILSIPIFTWIILESAISRTIYQDTTFSNRKYIFDQLEKDLNLAWVDSKIFSYINEIYLVRDAIEHNHIYWFSVVNEERLYTQKIAWFDTMIMKFASNKRNSNILNLHIIPDEIDINDCRVITKSLLEILDAFGDLDNGKLRTFFNGFLQTSYNIPRDSNVTNLRFELERFQCKTSNK